MSRRALAAVVAFLAACSGGSTSPPPPPPPSPGAIALGAAAYRVTEGGTLDLTLHRTGGSSGRVSVYWAAETGTAEDGIDFEYAYGTVTWADGDAADKILTVWTVNDALVEGDETFTVALSYPGGGATLGTASATITIADDDTPAAGAVRFSARAYAEDEGAGLATITVERSGGSAGAVSVWYGTVAGGTATAGADYTTVPTTQLTWSDGDASPKTFTVPILDDALPEPYETVALELAYPSVAPIAGPSRVDLTIRNDDTVIRLEQAAYQVGENGGTLRIRATKEGETPRAEVPLATTGLTATAGADFVDRRATFVWPERDTATLGADITILDDAVREGDETFTFALSPAAGVTLGTPSSATITIVDDEPPPEGILEFTKADYPVSNYAGAVTISVRRVGGTAGTVGVSYATADGTAAAGAAPGGDYTAGSGTLTWGPGDAADKTFTIPVLDDVVNETSETILLSLSTPTGGAALGPRQRAQVTISDDWTQVWNPVTRAVLARSPSTPYRWDDYEVESPCVVRLGPSSFVMYYQGGDDLPTLRRIGRASSTDGVTWTRAPADAYGWVLDAGLPGKFDELGVGKPSVLFDGTTWHMWYSNQDRNVNNDVPTVPRIGYATSTDGIAWTRMNGGDAVLAGGTIDDSAAGVSDPTVILDGGTYKMWYTAHRDSFTKQIAYAESTDGASWTKHGVDLPVLLYAAYDGWALSEPSVVKDGNTYRMWYSTRGSSYSRLMYAESVNGAAWQRFGVPLFEPSWQAWNDGTLAGPSALKDGERWLLWYDADAIYGGGIGLLTNP